MAICYTFEQRDEIRKWILELRTIVVSIRFRERQKAAGELVRTLDQCNFEPTSIIGTEFQRVRRIWTPLETEVAESEQRAKAEVRVTKNA